MLWQKFLLPIEDSFYCEWKDLNEENRDREIKGIVTALKTFNLKLGFILTYNQEDEFLIENKKIIIKPVWKWLLE